MSTYTVTLLCPACELEQIEVDITVSGRWEIEMEVVALACWDACVLTEAQVADVEARAKEKLTEGMADYARYGRDDL